MKVYIPIIIDRDGKQYENVSYTDKTKAENALHEFFSSIYPLSDFISCIIIQYFCINIIFYKI